jgi:hypothetical protein
MDPFDLVSGFLAPRDILNLAEATRRNALPLIKSALLTRHLATMTCAEKRAVLDMKNVPTISEHRDIAPLLFYREFRPDVLLHLVLNNVLLDAHTKSRLLSAQDRELDEWFSCNFLTKRPTTVVSTILMYISNEIEKRGVLTLALQYRFSTHLGAISVFNTSTNRVVAYAANAQVVYIEDNIVAFMTDKFVFQTTLALYNS